MTRSTNLALKKILGLKAEVISLQTDILTKRMIIKRTGTRTRTRTPIKQIKLALPALAV